MLVVWLFVTEKRKGVIENFYIHLCACEQDLLESNPSFHDNK